MREEMASDSSVIAIGHDIGANGGVFRVTDGFYDEFGPDRLMWASDCPFQVDDESYDDSVALIRDRLDYLSGDDREWILTKTAEQSFYTT